MKTDPQKERIRRFTPVQRGFHLVLLLTFITQSATGLARMYMETAWGRGIGALFGGYESSLAIHTGVGILMISVFAIHILYITGIVGRKAFTGFIFGPDSLVPRIKDIKDFFRHVGWFMGIRREPRFDRWGYWEKFDYWAVFWGIPILGITGLLLAFPVAATRMVPGWFLNIAFWIHRIEGILAMAHIYLIHFFIAHLRRSSFPMDLAMFEGSCDLAAARHEKPLWVLRQTRNPESGGIHKEGKRPFLRLLFHVFGYAAIAAGMYLFVGALANIPGVTW